MGVRVQTSSEVDEEEVEGILRISDVGLLLLLGGDLESNDEIASIRLTIELVLNRMKSGVFPRVMLSVFLESLVTRLQRLFGKKLSGRDERRMDSQAWKKS